jgi:hypothetical protein
MLTGRPVPFAGKQFVVYKMYYKFMMIAQLLNSIATVERSVATMLKSVLLSTSKSL